MPLWLKRLFARPWWVFAIAALLVVNLALLVLILTDDDRPGPSPATDVAAAPRHTPGGLRGTGDVRPECPRGVLRRGGVLEVTLDDRGLGMLGIEAPDGRLALYYEGLEHHRDDPDLVEAWRTSPLAVQRVAEHRRIYRIATGKLLNWDWTRDSRPLFDRPGIYKLRFAGNDPDAPDPWLRGSCTIRFVG